MKIMTYDFHSQFKLLIRFSFLIARVAPIALITRNILIAIITLVTLIALPF